MFVRGLVENLVWCLKDVNIVVIEIIGLFVISGDGVSLLM